MSTSGNYSLLGNSPAPSYHLGSFDYAQVLHHASESTLPWHFGSVDYSTAFLSPHIPPLDSATLGLEVTATKFHSLHSALTAIRLAQAAQHISDAVQAHGLTLPTVLCSTVGAGTTLAIETAGSAGMSAGIAAFALEAAANPSVLAATPAMAHMMAETHPAIEKTAHIAGEAMEQYCKQALAISQKLSGGAQ